MMRKVNKGVSMVEVLIALAIFMIMMAPLVSGLLSGMKTTGNAKELQNRNEYVQNLMESVKEVPISVLKDKDISYFEKLGSDGVTMLYNTYDTGYTRTNADGSTTPCPYEMYEIAGKAYLGVQHTQYSYLVQMSNEIYASQQGSGQLNPNNLTSGVVEDLDKTKVALISATLANYDTPAYEALLTRKMSELRKRQEKNNIASDPVNDVRLFDKDTGNRIINIAVKGNEADGYDVSCTLYYSDNCTEAASTGGTIGKAVGMVEYEPYKQHFEKLPNIYLMYNVCVYNGQYAKDYITYDLSGVDENAKVNVFVVETASTYSDDVKDTAQDKNWLESSEDVLYRKAGTNVRDNANIGMALSSISLTDKKRKNFHVYHNMSKPLKSDFMTEAEYLAAEAEWNSHKKNEIVTYSTDTATAVGNLFNDSSHVYESMEQKYDGISMVGSLNQAIKDSRGLYEIKIYMQKGNKDAAALKAGDPVLQGTRGGGEID